MRERAGLGEPRRLRRGDLVLIGLIAAAYLAGVTGRWWPTPDSAVYVGLGRSLANGQGYVFDGQASNLVAPGLPLAVAASIRLLGPGYWAPNLAVTLAGLAAPIVVFRTFARAGGRAVALAVAVLTACSYSYYLYAHAILTDVPFFLLFWLTVHACLRAASGGRGWLALAALLSVAGVAIRVPGLAASGVLAASLFAQWRWPGGSRRAAAAGASIVLALGLTTAALLALARRAAEGTPPYADVVALIGRQGLKRYFWHFHLAIADLPGETSSLFTGQDIAVVGYALLLLAGVGSVLLWRRGQRLWATMWIAYPLGVAFLAGNGSLKARYLMPVFPATAYAVLTGLEVVVAGLRATAGSRMVRFSTAVRVIVGLAVLLNAPKILRHAVWYSHVTGRGGEVVQDGRFDGLTEAVAAIRRGTRPEETLAVRADAGIVHLLSGRITLPYEPPGPHADDLSWVPAGATGVVVRLPKEEEAGKVCRRLASDRPPRMAKVHAGGRYEVYRVLPPPAGR